MQGVVHTLHISEGSILSVYALYASRYPVCNVYVTVVCVVHNMYAGCSRYATLIMSVQFQVDCGSAPDDTGIFKLATLLIQVSESSSLKNAELQKYFQHLLSLFKGRKFHAVC